MGFNLIDPFYVSTVLGGSLNFAKFLSLSGQTEGVIGSVELIQLDSAVFYLLLA